MIKVSGPEDFTGPEGIEALRSKLQIALAESGNEGCSAFDLFVADDLKHQTYLIDDIVDADILALLITHKGLSRVQHIRLEPNRLLKKG